MNFTPPKFELSPETKRGIAIILLLALGIIAALSLFDLAGPAGQYINTASKFTFGISRWYLPVIIIMVAYFLLRPTKYQFKNSNILGAVIFVLGLNALVHIFNYWDNIWEAAKNGLGGGLTGFLVAWVLLKVLGYWAGLVVALTLSVIGCFLLFELSFNKISEKQDNVKGFFDKLGDIFAQRKMQKIKAKRDRLIEEHEVTAEPEAAGAFLKREVDAGSVEVEQAGRTGEPKPKLTEEEKEQKKLDAGVEKFKATKIDLPLDLLDGRTTTPKGGDIKANLAIIQKTLENFGIKAEMGDAQVGPTVTQYTLKPAEGVKLSRITSLSDNLALALAAHPIRIEAPIPGRSLVGIEVPNQATAIVPLRDILISEAFKNRKSNLMVALGKDVMGKPWLAELDKMPHLLIAGATGSGKSVCINTVILSLLYQNGPGDLKLIMVDPKRVELPIYNGIPHLLTPVITDVKKTINALRWSIMEMEKRFDILSQARCRNIASYNASSGEQMPYIVLIIDELADLMAAAGPEVEAAIVRLAQMSRAVGIHLILATQRPSVDVITGLIKANITSRIAFSVASLVDSRTILDTSGAEKLLGRGDMLYISAEISKPKRLQGGFASDDEIKRVSDYLKERAEPDYVEEVVERQAAVAFDGAPLESSDGDPLLLEAKEVIIRAKKASASLLQRRLRVGYARAARILDLLEQQGVIGPGDGAKPREVLVGGGAADDDFSAMPDDEIPDAAEAAEIEAEEEVEGEEEGKE